ncbi:hypothetical protein CPLU01_05454 [Colletotrichum plurivorum]|uniref:Uncharacterized protein n=1 Tax=Colletotrichum plurivorum TaxID=2175906 RepID=A0A8H6KLQ3_9PEZI|nr:hypothetical protein CPLU01_05454 [Colletotrichum plurivorum]
MAWNFLQEEPRSSARKSLTNGSEAALADCHCQFALPLPRRKTRRTHRTCWTVLDWKVFVISARRQLRSRPVTATRDCDCDCDCDHVNELLLLLLRTANCELRTAIRPTRSTSGATTTTADIITVRVLRCAALCCAPTGTRAAAACRHHSRSRPLRTSVTSPRPSAASLPPIVRFSTLPPPSPSP